MGHTLLQTTAKTVQKGFSRVSGSTANPADDFSCVASLSGSQRPHLHKESGEIGLTFCSDLETVADCTWQPVEVSWDSLLLIPTKWAGKFVGWL